ncbi:hypothetical protein ACJMK2_021802, partial [Sinanodonta woodiana]
MMKLGMNIILFAAFIPAYANPVDCDVEYESCSWSVKGFVWISDNELNSTDGRNNIMHRKERNFLDGLCSWQKKESNVPAKVKNTVTELKSTNERSVLTAGFDICPGDKCLSFKYQMKDFKRECILIEVFSYDKISWSLVWKSQSQHQFHGWNEIDVTINVDKRSTIVILFQQGNCSNVTYYISSISLKNQSCTESTTTYITSCSTVLPTNSSKHTMTSNKTTKNYITTVFKLSSSDLATSTAVSSMNTSSHCASGMESISMVAVVVPVVAVVVVVVSLVLVEIC